MINRKLCCPNWLIYLLFYQLRYNNLVGRILRWVGEQRIQICHVTQVDGQNRCSAVTQVTKLWAAIWLVDSLALSDSQCMDFYFLQPLVHLAGKLDPGAWAPVTSCHLSGNQSEGGPWVDQDCSQVTWLKSTSVSPKVQPRALTDSNDTSLPVCPSPPITHIQIHTLSLGLRGAYSPQKSWSLIGYKFCMLMLFLF